MLAYEKVEQVLADRDSFLMPAAEELGYCPMHLSKERYVEEGALCLAPAAGTVAVQRRVCQGPYSSPRCSTRLSWSARRP